MRLFHSFTLIVFFLISLTRVLDASSSPGKVDWGALDKIENDELLKLYVYALRQVHLRKALPYFENNDVWGFQRGAFKHAIGMFTGQTGNDTTVPPGSACIEWGISYTDSGAFHTNCKEKWSFEYSGSGHGMDDKDKMVFQGSLDDQNLFWNSSLEGYFDAVVCTEVIEHVKWPHVAVMNLKRLLKPGGHLFITIPFMQRYHRGHGSETEEAPLDHYRYTDAGARHLLVDVAGMIPLERYFEGNNMITLGYMSSLGFLDFEEEDRAAMMIRDDHYKLRGTNELYYGTMYLLKNPGPAPKAMMKGLIAKRAADRAATSKPVSFHVVIITMGRKSLMRTLESLKGQLGADDYLTIAFDGVDSENVLLVAAHFIQTIGCTARIHFDAHQRGHAGHGLRQKLKQLQGDFIIHSDDDNYFLRDAFVNYRKYVVDRNAMYLFQAGGCNRNNVRTWVKEELVGGNIDTGNGVIPAWLNQKSNWGQHYMGDMDFYMMAGRLSIRPPVFVPVVTTIYTGTAGKDCPFSDPDTPPNRPSETATKTSWFGWLFGR